MKHPIYKAYCIHFQLVDLWTFFICKHKIRFLCKFKFCLGYIGMLRDGSVAPLIREERAEHREKTASLTVRASGHRARRTRVPDRSTPRSRRET